jgi:hypothetical protein
MAHRLYESLRRTRIFVPIESKISLLSTTNTKTQRNSVPNLCETQYLTKGEILNDKDSQRNYAKEHEVCFGIGNLKPAKSVKSVCHKRQIK